MYTSWVKVDDTLPWIELKGKYETRSQAKKAAKEVLRHAEIRIVEIPEKIRLKGLSAKQ